MTVITAKTALLPGGWRNDVRVTIDASGLISSIETDVSGIVSNRILLPAPANVHSHAFQRAMAGMTERRGADPADNFWAWRKLMYKFLQQLAPRDIEAITAFVHMEMLEAGFAASAEFHYLHHDPNGQPYEDLSELSTRIVAAAGASGIGLTLLPVFYEQGGCDGRPLNGGQKRFGNSFETFSGVLEGADKAIAALPRDAQLGVAPHSLRAVSRDSLIQLTELRPNAPLHIHLAEQVGEVEEVVSAYGKRPAEWLLGNHEVTSRWCLIHATQLDPHETLAIAETGAVAGLCPITESNLGDGIFDGVRFMNAGGKFGIGSDSNVRISLAEELRTLEYSQRLKHRARAVLATEDVSAGRRLFEAVANGGALALGRKCGSISTGCFADLMALDGGHVDLTEKQGDMILDSYIFAGDDRMVTDVWAAGRHQVVNGRHIQRDKIVEKYKTSLSALKDRL